MSRECSIPYRLKNSILGRWVNGHSAERIATWVNETHGQGPDAVATSRSSIERLIEHYNSSVFVPAGLPIVRRCRLEAPAMMDELTTVQAETWKCFELADQIDGTRGSGTKVTAKLRALAQAERFAMRRLKLAGIDSSQSDEVEDFAQEDADIGVLDDTFQEENQEALAKLCPEPPEPPKPSVPPEPPPRTPSPAAPRQPAALVESKEKSVRIEGQNCEKSSVNESNTSSAARVRVRTSGTDPALPFDSRGNQRAFHRSFRNPDAPAPEVDEVEQRRNRAAEADKLVQATVADMQERLKVIAARAGARTG